MKTKINIDDILIVVDVQNDFCPGGALEVKNGDEIIQGINNIQKLFSNIVFSRDWHPADHFSFSKIPEFIDNSWPSHCVENTKGAMFHPDLKISKNAIIINKGTNSDKEAYSAFDATDLTEQLKEMKIGRVFVCGLALDYCVKFTALDSLNNGFETILIENLTRGVDVPIGTAEEALNEIKNKGIKTVLDSDLS